MTVLGIGILSHIKTYLQMRDKAWLCLVFFYSNTASHHKNQEVKWQTDLGSLTLGLLHFYLYFNVKHRFNSTSGWPDQVTSHLWPCCAVYVACSDAGGVYRHSWYNREDLQKRGERDEVKERGCYWENKVVKATVFNRNLCASPGVHTKWLQSTLYWKTCTDTWGQTI